MILANLLGEKNINLRAPGDPDTLIENDSTSKTPFPCSSTVQEMFTEHLLCDWPMLGSAEDSW